MYAFSFSRFSMDDVTIRTPGYRAVTALIPSGADSRFTNTMFVSGTPLSSRTSIAASAVPPVASIGSSSSTWRCAMSAGSAE